jgi:hypothetical protein
MWRQDSPYIETRRTEIKGPCQQISTAFPFDDGIREKPPELGVRFLLIRTVIEILDISDLRRKPPRRLKTQAGRIIGVGKIIPAIDYE